MVASVLAALRNHAPERGLVLNLDRGPAARVSYPQLQARALQAGAAFRAAGVAVGARVVLPFATSEAAIVSFLGLIAAGAVPLSVKTASAGGGTADQAPWLATLAENFGACAIVDVDKHAAVPGLPTLAPPAPLDAACDALGAPHVAAGDDVAFVQFSSGTTSAPKGVPIRHAQLLQQLRQITAQDGRTSCDVGASWLPLYHDMGLVGGLLTSLLAGNDLHLWSPARFLLDPIGWLETLARERVSVTAMPSFGIAYLLRRLQEEAPELHGADLRALRRIYVGSDLVDPAALNRMQAALGPMGMGTGVFAPCYGMAEAVLMVSCSRGGAPRCVAPANGPSVASVGPLLPGFELLVQRTDGSIANDGEMGELLLAGGTLGESYLDAPQPFVDAAGFYRTGDLGFLDAGELFVVGRIGDDIKINGQRHSLAHLEQTLQAHPGVRPGGVAIVEAADGLIALVEPSRYRRLLTSTVLRQELAALLMVRNGIKLESARVVLLRAGQLPRTSSGKLQRSRLRQAVEDDRLALAED